MTVSLELSPSKPISITLHPVEPFDIEALTKIGIAAFPNEPQWLYRYPYADKHPDDHEKFTRERYLEWLEAAHGPDCSIIVAEIDDEGSGRAKFRSGKKTKVIAFGIWRNPRFGSEPLNEQLKPPSCKPFRKDCSPSHMAAYRKAITAAQTQVFDALYGPCQLSLAQLVTDPSYFRRGAGSLLIEWGIAFAERVCVPITVFAGPMASNLYRRYGFQTIVSVSVIVRHAEETKEIKFPGMKWEPSGYISPGKLTGEIQEIVVDYDEDCEL